MQSLRSAVQGLAVGLFPARCLGCGRRGQPLCHACEPSLALVEGPVCSRCALPRWNDRDCRGCKGLPAALATVRGVYVYQGAARAAVHRLKFRGDRALAPWMSARLATAARQHPLQADLVVPVPLASDRLRERGYNQALLLAADVPAATGGTLADSVLVRESRPAQRTLAAAERRQNLRGAFHCPEPALVAGKRVVLVDDVMTTGSTLAECARALHAAGAARVMALVFARDV
ncbi:MAG: ComF family protein [Chloroflexi bacterium]|nr:ComF family protein [Chloroflexota bacterium]